MPVEFPFPKLTEVLFIAFSAILGVVGLAAAVEGYIRTELHWIVRIVLGAGALMLIIPEIITDIMGYTIVLGIFIWSYSNAKKVKTKVEVEA